MIIGAAPIGSAPLGATWTIVSISQDGPVVVVTVRRRVILM